jgi:triphosphatase
MLAFARWDMAKAPCEVELKFALTPREAARLKRLALFRPGGRAAKSETLVSVYYDSDGFTLRDAGVSLRVRQKKSRSVQTLKALDPASGILRRKELENRIAGPGPDIGRLRRMAGTKASFLDNLDVTPVFETQIERTTGLMERGDAAAELAIDQGAVSSGKDSAPVCELEIELRRGDPAALFRMAREIGKAVPLRLAIRSKAEHGYRLVSGEDTGAEKAKPLALRSRMSTAEALQATGRNCLRQILANESGARDGDRNGVHQMRIGIRRLRSAMSVFGDVVADDQTTRLRADLKWLSGQLGAVRDTQVFLAEVLQPLQQQTLNASGIEELSSDFEARRLRAERQARRVLGSRRHRDLILAAHEWNEAGVWLRNEDPLVAFNRDRPVKRYAAEELARRRKKLIKRARKLADLDPPHRHQVRILAKKLRYATEFFRGLYTGKQESARSEESLDALKRMQDILGELNDIQTREALMREVVRRGKDKCRPPSPDRAFAAGLVFAGEDAKTKQLLQRAIDAAADFAAQEPFWS